MERLIQKTDGSQELFDEEKIEISLLKAGADEKTALSIIKKVREELKEDLIQAKDVYRLALLHLKKKQPLVAIKYTLKKAIMDFGPTGFIFEQYMARILREYGYETETDRVIRGFCVEHEIDVIAKKDNEYYMFECKYHNSQETKSDIKTALYIYARYLDIKKASENNKTNYNFAKAWLITNTRCTTNAIKYANCVNLGIIAWHYPEQKNLEYYIENKKLYPVTILPELKRNHKQKLLQNDVLTIRDILKTQPQVIASFIHSDEDFANKVIESAKKLYFT